MKRRAGKWCVKDAMMLAWIAVVLALICKMGHVSGTYDQCEGNTRTLTYAIDTTASMMNDIQQVCRQTQLISDALLKSPGNLLRSFVLVPFNDPGYGPVRRFSSARELTTASCGLRVSHGADCPEMSLSGLLLALEATCPRSTIFVFTDAISKDYNKLGLVLDAIQRRQIRVVFVLSGNCRSPDDRGYQVYLTIAERSAGNVFAVRKTEVSAILDFARRTLARGPDGLLLYRLIDRSVWTANFQVSPDTDLLSVAVSCPKSTPRVTLQSPNPTDISRAIRNTTDYSVFYSISIPSTGQWSASVQGATGCTIRITAVNHLALAFSYYFAAISNAGPRSPQASERPVQGQISYLYVATPPGVNLNRVDVVDVNGRLVARLTNVVHRNASHVVFGPFVAPHQSFFLRFTGQQQPSNEIFAQLSSTMVSPQAGDILDEFDPTTVVRREIAPRCGGLHLTCFTNPTSRQILWSHNGSALVSDGNRITIDGESQQRLSISPVQYVDAGRYTCQAVEATTFRQSQSLVISVNDQAGVAFSSECDYCQRIPCPGGSYASWSHNGRRISFDGTRYSLFSNGTIRICLPLGVRQGSYQCETRAGIWTFIIRREGRTFETVPLPEIFPPSPRPEFEVTCPELRSPAYGRLRISSLRPGGTAVLECDGGFDEATLTCQQDGRWSGSISNCPPPGDVCPRLPPLANGRISYIVSRITAGSYLDYVCSPGFVLMPSSARRRQCLPSGQWTGQAGLCVELPSARCPSLVSPPGGSVQVSSLTVGSTAQYSCNNGARLVGASMAWCLASRAWSSPMPTCRPRGCAPIIPGPNMMTVPPRLTLSSFDVGSTIIFICSTGYALQGKRTLQCHDNRQWSGASPRCIVGSRCPEPKSIPNGAVAVRDISVGSNVTYSCRKGFEISFGDAVRRCTANGRWTGIMPKCSRVLCPVLVPPANGVLSTTSRETGTLVTLRCKPGFHLTVAGVRAGTMQQFCSADGRRWRDLSRTWNYARCLAIQCPTPVAPDNGMVSGSGRGVGDTVVFQCNAGARLVPANSQRMHCQESGRWSGQRPSCEIIRCPPLKPLANGQFSSNAREVGTAVTARCHGGFDLTSGSSGLTCNAAGAWSGPDPMCEARSCGQPPKIANGQVAFIRVTFGSVARYSCNSGYRSDNDGGRPLVEKRCGADGTWFGPTLTCVEDTCRMPSVENGFVSLSDGEHDMEKGTVTVGSVVRSVCTKGYKGNNGDLLRTCTRTGRLTGTPLLCTEITCGEPPPVANGFYIDALPVSPLNTFAAAICNPGFRMAGAHRLQCGGLGTWLGRRSTCVAVDCGEPPTVGNATVSFSSTRALSQARYRCRSSCFELVGEPTLACTMHGRWSSARPQCKAVCTPPRILSEYTRPDVSSTGCLMLRCPVSGTPTPSVSWNHNGEAVEVTQRPGKLSTRSNEDFEICDGQPETHSGVYTCVATNDMGSTMKNITVPAFNCSTLWINALIAQDNQEAVRLEESDGRQCRADKEILQDQISEQAAELAQLKRQLAEATSAMSEMESRKQNQIDSLTSRLSAVNTELSSCRSLSERAVSQVSTSSSVTTSSCCEQLASAEAGHAGCQRLINNLRQFVSLSLPQT